MSAKFNVGDKVVVQYGYVYIVQSYEYCKLSEQNRYKLISTNGINKATEDEDRLVGLEEAIERLKKMYNTAGEVIKSMESQL